MLEIINLEYNLFKKQKFLSFERLQNQGNCNINYLLTTEHQKYIIREFKLKNDRESEFKIQKVIAKKNIGASPLLLDRVNRVMVSEFIKGEHKPKPNRAELKKLALLINRLHKIKTRQKRTNLKSFFDIKEKKALKVLRKINTYKKEFVLCHNDLHPQNILFGESVKLIDWEYAGINDKYFDLASVIIEFKLLKREEDIFLNSYFRRKSRLNREKLIEYKIIYKELWRVWFENLTKGKMEIEE